MGGRLLLPLRKAFLAVIGRGGAGEGGGAAPGAPSLLMHTHIWVYYCCRIHYTTRLGQTHTQIGFLALRVPGRGGGVYFWPRPNNHTASDPHPLFLWPLGRECLALERKVGEKGGLLVNSHFLLLLIECLGEAKESLEGGRGEWGVYSCI
jgi:hypothetical protein